MKKFLKTAAFIMAVTTVLSFSGLSASVSAKDTEDTVKGNVPVTFIPNSEITFDAEGNFEITNAADKLPVSRSVGQEIGGNLMDEYPEVCQSVNQAVLEEFENLPVYRYEEYYIAHEGATALYDDSGELIRVRGNFEYYSTLDQYRVNGSLPDGKYIGTYLTFSQITSQSPAYGDRNRR